MFQLAWDRWLHCSVVILLNSLSINCYPKHYKTFISLPFLIESYSSFTNFKYTYLVKPLSHFKTIFMVVIIVLVSFLNYVFECAKISLLSFRDAWKEEKIFPYLCFSTFMFTAKESVFFWLWILCHSLVYGLRDGEVYLWTAAHAIANVSHGDMKQISSRR